MAKFTEYELKALETHPDALRAAADYNDSQESEADAQGYDSCAEHHRARRIELAAEADRIEREWTGSTASGSADAIDTSGIRVDKTTKNGGDGT